MRVERFAVGPGLILLLFFFGFIPFDHLSAAQTKDKSIRCFYLAFLAKDWPGITSCIKNGADVNVKVDKVKTPLLLAVEKSAPKEIISMLIQAGANTELSDSRGRTPLIVAVLKHDKEVIKILLESGANYNLKDNDGKSAMNFASASGNQQMVYLLVETRPVPRNETKPAKGSAVIGQPVNTTVPPVESEPSATTSHPPAPKLSAEAAKQEIAAAGVPYTLESFLERIRRRDLDLVRLFLAAGMLPDAKDQNGDTALIWAASEGFSDVATLLIEKGADVNATAKDLSTPLMVACLQGHPEMVEILLKEKAHVDRRNEDGLTALSLAVQTQNQTIIELLQKAGAKE